MMHVAPPSPGRGAQARSGSICVYSSSEVRLGNGVAGLCASETPAIAHQNPNLLPMVSVADQKPAHLDGVAAKQSLFVARQIVRHRRQRQLNSGCLRTTHDPKPVPIATSIMKSNAP